MDDLSFTLSPNYPCVISRSIIITVNNTAPPILNTTQPDCTSPLGSFSIASPLGANYFYSKDGLNYQPGTLFSGLNPGNYAVTAKDTSTGCISSSTNVTINAVPFAPQAPFITSVINPSCTTPTVSLTVASPLGANLVYSNDGINYQAAVLFDSLPSGIYTFTVKDINTGCISPFVQTAFSGTPTLTPPPSVADIVSSAREQLQHPLLPQVLT